MLHHRHTTVTSALTGTSRSSLIIFLPRDRPSASCIAPQRSDRFFDSSISSRRNLRAVCNIKADNQLQVSSATAANTARTCSILCQASHRSSFESSDSYDGDALARMITTQVAAAETVTALENVCAEWGGSFNYIHASATLRKLAVLPGKRKSPALLTWLKPLWLDNLSQASSDARACATVLWVFGKLGASGQVWDATWDAFMSLVVADSKPGSQHAVSAQDLSNVLWAAARASLSSRWQADGDEVQLLLQAVARPAVLRDANAQDLSNLLWALGELTNRKSCRGAITGETVQQLLGPQQVQVVVGGIPQNMSNALLGLGKLGGGQDTSVPLEVAQSLARQLLHSMNPALPLAGWKPIDVAGALWGCGRLGLQKEEFVVLSLAGALMWLPKASVVELYPMAQALADLRVCDTGLVQALLSGARRCMQTSGSRGDTPLNKCRLAAACAAAVADLDLRRLPTE